MEEQISMLTEIHWSRKDSNADLIAEVELQFLLWHSATWHTEKIWPLFNILLECLYIQEHVLLHWLYCSYVLTLLLFIICIGVAAIKDQGFSELVIIETFSELTVFMRGSISEETSMIGKDDITNEQIKQGSLLKSRSLFLCIKLQSS